MPEPYDTIIGLLHPKRNDENEQKFGVEIREKYGDEAIDQSNNKILEMNQNEWICKDDIEAQMIALLKQAQTQRDCSCNEAMAACKLHRKWIRMFWPNGSYSAAAHRSLADVYITDKRFVAYYDDKLGKGGAEFLHDAIYEFTK